MDKIENETVVLVVPIKFNREDYRLDLFEIKSNLNSKTINGIDQYREMIVVFLFAFLSMKSMDMCASSSIDVSIDLSDYLFIYRSLRMREQKQDSIVYLSSHQRRHTTISIASQLDSLLGFALIS
jgi:hypothetical protein